MRTLEILARLHRRELDRERGRLDELDGRIAEVEAAIGALRAERAREMASGAGRPEHGGPFLGAYLEGGRRREGRLRAELADLTGRRAAAEEQVRARLAEIKRYEVLAERAARRAELDARRRERRELDELAALRRGRHEPHV